MECSIMIPEQAELERFVRWTFIGVLEAVMQVLHSSVGACWSCLSIGKDKAEKFHIGQGPLVGLQQLRQVYPSMGWRVPYLLQGRLGVGGYA